MALKLWVRLIKRHHTARDCVKDIGFEGWEETLKLCCREMDLSYPVVMSTNTRDMEQFSRTLFRPNQFMDAFPFDRLEIETFDPDDQKPKKMNPDYA